jgi:hypothetical protein
MWSGRPLATLGTPDLQPEPWGLQPDCTNSTDLLARRKIRAQIGGSCAVNRIDQSGVVRL